jgi:hypothetical protein
MDSTYDIYKRLAENRLAWMDRVRGLEEARQRAVSLVSTTLGEYLIYDFREKAVLEVLSPTSTRMVA